MKRRGLLVGVGAALSMPAARAQSSLLRIGFQKSAVNLVVLKQQGALEKRFPSTKVQWVEFPAGPQLLEALAVGGLEFGLTGDSPLKTLAELKGRRVALQKGSSAHYRLVRAVDKAGLQWSDILPIYLPPSDARAIWDPFYAATELDIKPRALSTGQGLSGNNSFYLASRTFTEGQPLQLSTLFEELTRADALVQGSRKEAAQLISDFSGLSLATVHLFLSRRPVSPVGPLSPAIVADQQRVADIVWTPARLARS